MLESKLFSKLEKFASEFSIIDVRNEEKETYFEFETKSDRKEFKKILRNHGLYKTQYVRDSYYDEYDKKQNLYRIIILDIPFTLSEI